MKPYIVRQGDYLAKLAHLFGFSAEAVWNDDSNKALREKRKNPEILYPGDVLFIPEPTLTPVPLKVGEENRFVATIPKVTVEIAVGDGEVLYKGEDFELLGPKRTLAKGTTDGRGIATLEVPVHLSTVRVKLPKRDLTLVVQLGRLDPASEPSGVEARLEHLGYLDKDTHVWLDRELAEELRQERLERAMKRFQEKQRLEPTGVMDEATRDALVAEHGS